MAKIVCIKESKYYKLNEIYEGEIEWSSFGGKYLWLIDNWYYPINQFKYLAEIRDEKIKEIFDDTL